jgi:hypothetical protein
MAHRQNGLPAVETDGLAEEQPRDHRGKPYQVTLISDREVLTQEDEEFKMKGGTGHR